MVVDGRMGVPMIWMNSVAEWRSVFVSWLLNLLHETNECGVICVSEEVRVDIRWFERFLSEYNGVTWRLPGWLWVCVWEWVFPIRISGRDHLDYPPHFCTGDVGGGGGSQDLGTAVGEGQSQGILWQWRDSAGDQQWQVEGCLYATLLKGDRLLDCQSTVRRASSALSRGLEQVTRPVVQMVP